MTTGAEPTPRSAVVRTVAIGVALPLLFVFFFVFPAHDPEPNGLPIGIAAPAPVAERLASALESREDGLDVRTFADAGALRAAIGDRAVYGGLVAPGGRPTRVLISSAQSATVASLLGELGRAAGATRVEEVTPLAEDDPRGVTLNVLVLPVIITAILGALLAVQLTPLLRTRQRLPLVALTGLLAGLGTVGLVRLLDALRGPYLAEAGIVALAIIAIALTAGGLIRVLGPPGVMVAFLLFLMLGSPASGLAGAPELLPTPWAQIGPLLPPGAVGSALRGTAYFDGARVLGPIVVLLAWAGVGIALNLVADRRRAG